MRTATVVVKALTTSFFSFLWILCADRASIDAMTTLWTVKPTLFPTLCNNNFQSPQSNYVFKHLELCSFWSSNTMVEAFPDCYFYFCHNWLRPFLMQTVPIEHAVHTRFSVPHMILIGCNKLYWTMCRNQYLFFCRTTRLSLLRLSWMFAYEGPYPLPW